MIISNSDIDMLAIAMQGGNRKPQISNPVGKFGENLSIDTLTVPEDVWSGGGLYPFPATAQTTTIVSTSTEDNPAGTGAHGVYYQVLLDEFVEYEGYVQLNGLTPVTLPVDVLRCNRMYVGQCGTNEVNVGTIELKHGTTKFGEIQPEHGQTTQAIYTVPAGYYGYIHTVHVGLTDIQTDVYADVHVMRRSNIPPITGWRMVRDNIVVKGSPYVTELSEWTSTVRGGDDIRVLVESVSSNGVRVYAEYDLHLFRDV